MIKGTNTTLSLSGLSGKQYIFNLYTFDSFAELKDAFKPIPALYLFTKRWLREEDKYSHDLIYLGETSDLSLRFNQHHKEKCIISQGANCIGVFSTSVADYERIKMEEDVLGAYDFPCNVLNNS